MSENLNQCKNLRFCITEANNISDEQKEKIRELINEGGQVCMDYFDDGWSRNPIVATIWDEDRLVACGALKVPANDAKTDYKEDVFSKAKSKIDHKTIERELGWLVTDEDCKGNGFCNSIIKALLKYNKENLENKPLFATARKDNLKICKIFKTNNFHKTGIPYKSCRDDYELVLYTNTIINSSCNTISNVVEVHQFKQDFLDKMENPEKFAIMNEKTFSSHIGYQRQYTSD